MSCNGASNLVPRYAHVNCCPLSLAHQTDALIKVALESDPSILLITTAIIYKLVTNRAQQRYGYDALSPSPKSLVKSLQRINVSINSDLAKLPRADISVAIPSSFEEKIVTIISASKVAIINL